MENKKHISFVNDVVPAYMLEDGNNTLLQILDYYYKHNQETGNYLHDGYHFLDYLNSKDVNNYKLYHQLLYRLLPTLTIEQDELPEILTELFKFSKSFYNNKGNIASYKHLFGLLFKDKNVEITHTADYLLRSSDGVMLQENTILIKKNTTYGLPIELLLGNKENVVIVNANNTYEQKIIINTITDIGNNTYRLTFNEKQQVFLNDDDSYYITLNSFDDLFKEIEITDTDLQDVMKKHTYFPIYKQIGNKYKIIHGGNGYQRDTVLTYDLVSKYDPSHIIKYADLPDSLKRLQIVISDVDYNGTIKKLDIKTMVHNIITEFDEFDVIINTHHEDDETKNNDTRNIAIIELQSGYNQFERKQIKHRSTLSTEYRLRDVNYYHEYGYTVNTKYHSPNAIYNLIKDIIHPAGMQLVFNNNDTKDKIDVGNQGMLYAKSLHNRLSYDDRMLLGSLDKDKIATTKEIIEKDLSK